MSITFNGAISGQVLGNKDLKENDQALSGVAVVAGPEGPCFTVEGFQLRVASKQLDAVMLGGFKAQFEGQLSREHYLAEGLAGSEQVAVTGTLVRGLIENDKGEEVEDTRRVNINLPSRMVLERGDSLETYAFGGPKR